MAKKQRESLKQQKALLEAYAKTFSDEGKPVDAKVDLSQVEGLDLRENDNDTNWVEKLSNVGSDGTDILVKAMVNIMLINVFKRKIFT